MTIRDCIALTMKTIGFVLDNKPIDGYCINWCEIHKRDNFNKCYLGLDEKGFYIEEQKQFNGEFAYRDERYLEDEVSIQTRISPFYVVRLLFEKEEIFKRMDIEKDMNGEYTPQTVYSMEYGISQIIRFLNDPEYDLAEYLDSYLRINDLICEIRESQDKGKIYPISYSQLMTELDKIKVKGFGISCDIKKIKHMSYEEIACIALSNPKIARLLALMEQIEFQLMRAGYLLAANSMVKQNIISENEVSESVKKLDKKTVLDTRVRSWDDFCECLYQINYNDILFTNSDYYHRTSRGKLETFGLDVVSTPGTPKDNLYEKIKII